MTMLRIGLRFHRTGLIACAAIGGLNGILQSFGFKAVAGASEVARQQFGVQMQVLGRQISYLIPLPVHPETLSGYVQWRVFGFLPLVFGFWALMAGSGVVRGDEERGLLELWLGAGMSRARLAAARGAAFVLADAGAIVVACTLTGIGANAVGSPMPVAGLVADGASLLALSATCFGIALLVAQLVDSRRAAAGAGGILLLGLFLLNSLGRTLDGPAHFRALSPFFYADQTNGLSPGGHVDWASTIGLSFAAVALIALAGLAFSRRDLGSGLVRRRPAEHPPVHEPSRNPLLRVPVLATLYEQRLGLLAWMVSIALLAVFLTSLARSLADIIRGNPVLRTYISGQGDLNRAVIGVFWFGTVSLLLAVFAITQVSRWASDDTDGHLEMMLSEPVARWRVALEREGALLIATALIATAGSLVTIWVAGLQGIGLGIGPVVLATAMLLPFGLTFGSLGAGLSGWIPRATVILLSAYAVVAYFLTQLAPLFKWPAWAQNLSVFYLYGTPLTSGVYWTGLWILLVVIGVALSIGLLSFQRRDLGR